MSLGSAYLDASPCWNEEWAAGRGMRQVNEDMSLGSVYLTASPRWNEEGIGKEGNESTSHPGTRKGRARMDLLLIQRFVVARDSSGQVLRMNQARIPVAMPWTTETMKPGRPSSVRKNSHGARHRKIGTNGEILLLPHVPQGTNRNE